jgi:thiosulfate reductase cytochrome b subunit
MADQIIFRHTLTVRITHWVNVLSLTVLLMSGLQIFNAHPALYIGDQSNFDHPILSMTAQGRNARLVGLTNLAGTSFTTTGVFGMSKVAGADTPRAFPSWSTLPAGQDLATARRWHFLFAWLFVVNGRAELATASP